MEKTGADEGGDKGAIHQPSEQLFNVVYDPRFDRFFLEDEAVYRGKNRPLEHKAISIPWEKWILPSKSPPKRGQQCDVGPTELQRDKGSVRVLAVASSTTENTAVEVTNGPLNGNAGQGNQAQTLPTLDFSSFQQPLTEVSAQNITSIPVDPSATNKSKKTRRQDYTVHFKRTNQDVAETMAAGVASAKAINEHEVKWNGEVLRVQIPGFRSETEISSASTTVGSDKPDALQRERLHGSSEEQWPGSTYELKHLMRIRAHADGLRSVNSACRFVAVSSSESSDSEEEEKIPPQQESEEETELMPVFFRDDRVLFHAKQRWFKGTVRLRIPRSDFYNIRADNGSLFEAVLASKMELLDEPEELPYYLFARGDKVLWGPDCNDTVTNVSRPTIAKNGSRRRQSNNTEEELTYKAKIVQVRSLDRFDIVLRTGRVVKKVPYEQLQPRDVSDFVSTRTLRRR